jgi:hypothetical protein
MIQKTINELISGGIMKATKSYGECSCGCGERISRRKEFEVVDGEFYLEGHSKNKPPKSEVKGKAKGKANSESKAQRKPGTPISQVKKGDIPNHKGGLKRKTEQKPAETPAAAPQPKADKKPKEKRITPNSVVISMLCETKHSDDEIFNAVVEQFPGRDTKQIRADISVNRSMINSGRYYRSYIDLYQPKLPLKKMVRVTGELYPADKAPAVQEQPQPERKKGLLRRTTANKG